MPLDDPIVFISYARSDLAFASKLSEDLRQAGHAVWMDVEDIRGGDRWVRTIAAAIQRCYAFVTVVSRAGNESDWVARELLFAQGLGKEILPVLAEEASIPLPLVDREYVDLRADRKAGLPALFRSLIPLRSDHQEEPRDRRALEMAYLNGLRFGDLAHTEAYTPMAGTAHTGAGSERRQSRLRPVVMRQSFDVFEKLLADERETPRVTRGVEDVLEALNDVPRVAVLGEPGAGKTTTLWKIARDRVETAADDPEAPLPLLVRLGAWTESDEPLLEFVAGQVGHLGSPVETLLKERRALLLLDGLNETPVAQRAQKAGQVRSLIERYGDLGLIVTCRELDYVSDLELDLDRIVIRPLDPERIRDFIGRYLESSERTEDMFWKLAGSEATRKLWEIWERAGVSGEFWTASEIPKLANDLTTWEEKRLWHEAVHGERSLMRLAANPYMLWMLTRVYHATADLPPNRGRLFENFTRTLLSREGMTDPRGNPNVRGRKLIDALADLAYEMQTGRAEAGDDANVVTSMSRAEVVRRIDEELLQPAAGASLLSVGDDVRFTHQLLQEYFAARGMRRDFDAGRSATAYWPTERFWERTNWEEVAVLFAGTSEGDADRALEWLAAASPEVAADAALRGGLPPTPDLLARWHQAWLRRLTDVKRDLKPEDRAAIGRALEVLGLDDRPGVGLRSDGVPDIAWVEIPAGPFVYQDGQRLELETFHIARYCVTHLQFQFFVEAEDGYRKGDWWEGPGKRPERPAEARWPIGNHPRETVSCFEAVAFCRWLGERLSFEVRLPFEQEWEKAARGEDGRVYPWGDEYVSGYANIDEHWQQAGPHQLGRTSTVGAYPAGESPQGIADLSGNVWEWTGSDYETGRPAEPRSTSPRVLRGGPWIVNKFNACASFRYYGLPGSRNDDVGFRVLCSSPISR